MLQHGTNGLRAQDRPPTSSAEAVYLVELDEPEEEGDGVSTSSTDSEGEATPVTATKAHTRDAEELDLNIAVPYAALQPHMCAVPNLRGKGQPTFDDLDKMPKTEARNRLIQVDFIHPYNPRLKAGYQLFLLCRDYVTGYLWYQPLRKRDEATDAFGAIAISAGWPKTAHPVRIVSDGEPSLVMHIRQACRQLGLIFGTSAPNRPNTNHAGSGIIRELRRKVNCTMSDSSQHGTSVLGGEYEALFWAAMVDVNNKLANRTDVHNRTPYELQHGVRPVFNGLPIGWPCYMAMTKEGRRAHILRGGPAGNYRGEAGLYLGLRYGHHRMLTTRGSSRSGAILVDAHGSVGMFPGSDLIQVTADGRAAAKPGVSVQPAPVDRHHAVTTETGVMLTSADAALRIQLGRKNSRKPYIAARCLALSGLTVAQALKQSFPNSDGTVVPYRRCDYDYDLRCQHLQVQVTAEAVAEGLDPDAAAALHASVMVCLDAEEPSETYNLSAPQRQAALAKKDDIEQQRNLSWKQFLASPQRQEAIAAFEKEITSIVSMGVMTELQPGTAQYARALKSPATTMCSVLLDRKRTGELKARIVVRGDLENKIYTDGQGFNYSSTTAAWPGIRALVFQSGRHVLKAGQTEAAKLKISIRDVCNAYCQSNRFGDDVERFLRVHSPIDQVWRYYDQQKPLYGSCSAPKRWQDTFQDWMTSSEEQGGPGFVQGQNAPAIYTKTRGDKVILQLILYVDDLMLIGTEDDQNNFYSQLTKRFDCKPEQWLKPGHSVDYLGVTIHEDETHVYMCMEPYIKNMLVILNMPDCIPMNVPFTGSITDLKELSADRKQWFITAVGMIGWLSHTTRPDIRYAYSRVAQHVAKPCQGAFDKVVQIIRYLATTAKLSLRQELNVHVPLRCYCDADFAGNAELGNARRSQHGYIILQGSAVMAYCSKVSSIQFGSASLSANFDAGMPAVTAHAAISDEHADTSSAAAETYALGTFASEVLAYSYVVEEAGMPVPRPVIIQVDNMAALAFSKQTSHSGRSKLRHIDCRLQWLKVLRDSNLIQCVHVSTEHNVADLFTKALDTPTFTRHRDSIMFYCPY